MRGEEEEKEEEETDKREKRETERAEVFQDSYGYFSWKTVAVIEMQGSIINCTHRETYSILKGICDNIWMCNADAHTQALFQTNTKA